MPDESLLLQRSPSVGKNREIFGLCKRDMGFHILPLNYENVFGTVLDDSAIRELEGMRRFNDGLVVAGPSLRYKVRQAVASRAGLDAAQIGANLESAMLGSPAVQAMVDPMITGEYDMYEFNLGHTLSYAEMAALIAPRPFMVERGHFDGVAPDETVGYEFAKVRHLYAAQLGLPDRAHIEWFVGPHTIHGVGTYEFLHKHLNWPKPKE